MKKTIQLKKQGECFYIEAKNSGGQWDTKKFDGRTIKYEVCLVGPAPGANLAIFRGGRRGGIRSEGKKQGGMVACGVGTSGCIRTKNVFVFPGGSAALKRKGIKMFNGKKRKSRRSYHR
jgi:hypothetical protein